MNILLNLLSYAYLWIIIIFAILIHEAGHLLIALACKVPVEKFSIGFGKPVIFKKKWKGIIWQITPWLVGGYTALYGETDIKKKKGFLAQRWLKKAAILVAGVSMNFLLACLCYLFMYKSIFTGIYIDIFFMKAMFVKNPEIIFELLRQFNINPFLIQISLINLFCAITNILPLPALDGGQIWLCLTEKLFKKKKNYETFMYWINKIGFWFLMIGQVFVIYYLWFRK